MAAKLDYTKEYRALIESFVPKDEVKMHQAAAALGLQYDADPIKILMQLNKHYIVTGAGYTNSSCILREHETV